MNIQLLEQEPLARYTSWKIGGLAQYFANAQTPAELLEALQWAHERDMPVFVLGGGSNVLVSDGGVSGLVLRYRASETAIVSNGDSALVQVDAGAPMAGTVRKLCRQGWAGLDWAEGLPGTIGGALFGNAGCYGGAVESALTRAWLLINGEIQEWPVAQFGYGYRTSVLKRGLGARAQGSEVRVQQTDMQMVQTQHSTLKTQNSPIILRAEFALHKADPAELAQVVAERAEQRRSKTPQGQSCGSVFKNPPGDSAGHLLEAAGLKGTQVGGAEVAAKHANYIVNRGNATAADVLGLVELARKRVLHEFGVQLELEVQIVGDEMTR